MFHKIAIVFAALIASSSVFAADSQPSEPQQSPLAPAGSAGVEHAQMFDGANTVFFVGGAVVLTAVVLAVTANGGGHSTTTSAPTSTR